VPGDPGRERQLGLLGHRDGLLQEPGRGRVAPLGPALAADVREERPPGHGSGPLDESGERGLVPGGLVVSPGVGRLRRQVHQDHRQDVGVVGGDGELVGALARESRGVVVTAEAEDVRQRLLAVPRRRRSPDSAAIASARRAWRSASSRLPRCHQVWAW
jgi:hypothetical protein